LYSPTLGIGVRHLIDRERLVDGGPIRRVLGIQGDDLDFLLNLLPELHFNRTEGLSGLHVNVTHGLSGHQTGNWSAARQLVGHQANLLCHFGTIGHIKGGRKRPRNPHTGLDMDGS
ncbi:MAG: hypothetical protein ACRDGS_09065, partial [Chloroflexota bacterium]